MFKRPKKELIVYLFCEGKTESKYIMEFVKKYNNLVHIMEKKTYCTHPNGIVEKALHFIEENKQFFGKNINTPSEIWVVFDHDDKIIYVKKAFKLIEEYNNRLKKAVKLNLAYTCPCFEVWALLHYNIPVSKIPYNRKRAQSLLKKYMKKYKHNGNICFDFQELTEQRYKSAVKKAKVWENTENRKIINASRYTTVHHLTERIRKVSQ
jgi:hypothetical protein